MRTLSGRIYWMTQATPGAVGRAELLADAAVADAAIKAIAQLRKKATALVVDLATDDRSSVEYRTRVDALLGAVASLEVG